MHFQLNILAGIAVLALPAGAQAMQLPPAKAPATQPAGTVPDEASAGANAKTGSQAQSQTPESNEATSTASTSAQASSSEVKVASAADVKSGITVYDQSGGIVGKIDSVSAKGAVVNTGKVKASIPVSSFAKNNKGLVLSMTRAELEAAAKKKSPK